MSVVGVASDSVSLDGYGAGPAQDLNNPLGVGGMALHEWLQERRLVDSRPQHHFEKT